MREIDDVTGLIVDAAYRLHVDLGPGLLESVYLRVLADQLEKRGLIVERQKDVAFDFDGTHFENGLRVDLLVERIVVVELKSVEELARVHYKQVLTYLRLLRLPVGLLINLGGATLKGNVHRIANNYRPQSSAAPRLRVNRSAGEPVPERSPPSPVAGWPHGRARAEPPRRGDDQEEDLCRHPSKSVVG
jgi:iron complex transport system substrate-binding protein